MSQFLYLDVLLRHSVDKFYNLSGILPVGTRQFLDLDEEDSPDRLLPLPPRLAASPGRAAR